MNHIGAATLILAFAAALVPSARVLGRVFGRRP